MRILTAALLLLLAAFPVQAQGLPEINEWENTTDPGWGYAFFTPAIDSSVPSPSGGGALKFTYPAGTYSTSLGPGKAYYTLAAPQPELYTGFWIRFSPGFVQHPISTKILYQYGSLNSNTTGSLPYMTVRTTSYSGNQCCSVDIGIQGNGAAGSLSKSLPHTLANNKASGSVKPGTSQWMEVHVKGNSAPTVNDGVLEIWLDEVLTHQYFNLLYFDKVDGFKELSLAPEYGGGGASTIPSTQYIHYDHTVIQTSRIGRPGTVPVEPPVVEPPVIVPPVIEPPVVTASIPTPQLTLSPLSPTSLLVSVAPMDSAYNVNVRLAPSPISWGSANSPPCPSFPCTITGLIPDKLYDAQAVAYTGALNGGAAFGSISPPVSVRTLPAPIPSAGLKVLKATDTQAVITAPISALCTKLTYSRVGSTPTTLRMTIACAK